MASGDDAKLKAQLEALLLGIADSHVQPKPKPKPNAATTTKSKPPAPLDQLLPCNANDDCYLQAQLQSLITGAPGQKSKPPPTANRSSDASAQNTTSKPAKEPTIEQQIKELRQQLNQAHSAFSTARDQLAGISFADMRKYYTDDVLNKLRSGGGGGADGADGAGAGGGDHLNDPPTNAELLARVLSHHKNIEIPQPFDKFFGIMANLHGAVQMMCATDVECMRVNAKGMRRLEEEAKYVHQLRECIRATAEGAGLTEKEQRDLERMADEEALMDG